MTSENLLSRKECAEKLGVSVKTLSNWLCTGAQPLPVVKIGRLAKYRLSDVKTFIEMNVKIRKSA